MFFPAENGLPAGAVIGLSGKNGSDEVIISTLSHKETIYETFIDINNKIGQPLDELDYNSTVQIPMLNFRISSVRSNIPLSENGKVDYLISEAHENITFNLGRTFRNPYVYYAGDIKRMFFIKSPFLKIDKPFVIYIKDKSAALPFSGSRAVARRTAKNLTSRYLTKNVKNVCIFINFCDTIRYMLYQCIGCIDKKEDCYE